MPHFLLDQPGDVFSGFGQATAGGQVFQIGDCPRLARELPDAGQQGHLVHIGCSYAAAAILVVVLQEYGLDDYAVIQSRLDQPSPKGLEVAAVCCGAFREKSHAITCFQVTVDFFFGVTGGFPTAALNVKRTGQCDQLANQWPVADFGFRDKSAGGAAVDHENIKPGNVIGNDQSACGKQLDVFMQAALSDFDVQNCQQLAGPTAQQFAAFSLRQFRKALSG